MHTRLAILVTTACNLRCPECCYRVPHGGLGEPRHYPWDYFEAAAEHLRGLAVLYVSGGEPTLHPQFRRIAVEFRRMFAPQKLVLATNGAKVIDHLEWLECFDLIKFTRFPEPTSREAFTRLQAVLPRKISLESADHVPMSMVGAGHPCKRREIAAYSAGRVYPCCVAPGIDGAASVELTPQWRECVAALHPPCARCPFSTKGGPA